MTEWIKEFPASITVCDAQGILLEMNDLAARMYENEGGYALIGTNMLECHPPAARLKTEELLETKKGNVYTIQKRGIKKLIFQSPWYAEGKFAGFVELGLEIPESLPHFNRG